MPPTTSELIVALDAPDSSERVSTSEGFNSYIHVLPEASKKKTMRLLTHIYTFSGRNESTGIGNDKGMHTLHEEWNCNNNPVETAWTPYYLSEIFFAKTYVIIETEKQYA